MHLPSLFVLVVYVSAYILLLFGAISLACGLYYLVELAEEYTRFTKRLIRIAILAELGVHFLLWAYERMWFVPNAVGVISHLSYLFLLRGFPYIEPASAPFLLSCALFATSNIVWYRYFHSDPEFFYQYRVGPATSIAFFFFLCIWLVPLGFFVSLTVNDSVLPGGAGMPNPNAKGPDEKKKRTQNIFALGVRSAWNSVRNATGMNNSSRDILSAQYR